MELDEPQFRNIGIGVRSVEEASPATRRFIKHAQNWLVEKNFRLEV